MSLLEDVFLEDEAGEAQELERIIEGDDDEDRPRERSDSDENSAKEDEAEEDKRRVDPSSTKTKRVVKNPRFVLNPARLTGPRGISVIPEHFKDFKFKGKGHEKEDLDLVLKKLEHWAYRLYPKFKFEDCLKKIETLGKKRTVSVHLTKIRSDQLVSSETVVQKDSSDEEDLAAPLPVEDEFDQLLQQQIELAKATPRPGDHRLSTPHADNRSPFMAPKATSSPSISDEQRERMIRNRKLAEERRLARLKAAENGNTGPTVDLTNGNTVSSAGNPSPTVDLTNAYGNTGSNVNLTNGNMVSNVDLTIGNTVSNVDLTNDNTGSKVDLTNGNTVANVDLTNGHTDNSNEVDQTNAYEAPRAKKNRSNIIDSSDEEEMAINEEVTVDIHRNENMIDLTEIQRPKKTTNDVELVITGEPDNKKNDINCDDDEMNIIQKSKRIASDDVELVITGEPNKKKNVILSDDDDVEETNINNGDVIHQNVDIIEGDAAQKSSNSNEKNINTLETVQKSNDTNDLDSSDEDDNVMAVSEAIVVDIHKNNKNDIIQVNYEENTLKIQDEVTENVKTVNSTDKITDVDDKTNMDQVSSEINNTDMNFEQNNDEFKSPTAEKIVNAAENMGGNDKTNTNETKDTENVCKDNQVLEDLMDVDVDFSDDF
ncbi:replication fork protection component swi3 domain-containing protein [Phthorimaea operculella]|nr:replication fork protection component swi3 domain-containing protein [Phthorimaea operculella]